MAMRVALTFALALLVASGVRAQTVEEQSVSKTKNPDYSENALLEFVLNNPDLVAEDGEGDFYIDGGFVYSRGSWLFRYIPIMAPLLVSQAADANVTLMPTVEPFTMTGTGIPYSKSSFRDRWEERRIRRTLLRNVAAANRRQND